MATRITETDLADRYHGVIAEVHYKYAPTPEFLAALDPQYRDPSMPVITYNTGILTTEHPASSYGLPVFVAGSNMRHHDPLVPGQVYGPADLPDNYQMLILPYHHLTDESCLPVPARRAGYNCQIGESPDGMGR